MRLSAISTVMITGN